MDILLRHILVIYIPLFTKDHLYISLIRVQHENLILSWEWSMRNVRKSLMGAYYRQSTTIATIAYARVIERLVAKVSFLICCFYSYEQQRCNEKCTSLA